MLPFFSRVSCLLLRLRRKRQVLKVLVRGTRAKFASNASHGGLRLNGEPCERGKPCTVERESLNAARQKQQHKLALRAADAYR
jgi:hypothetical protein